MTVRVKLFNQLRRYAPDGEAVASVDLPADASLADLLDRLKIPTEAPRTTLVNGRRVPDGTRLCAGDEVVLMSPIEGG